VNTSSTNCARAEATASEKKQNSGKIAVFLRRSLPAHNFLDLTFEHAIVVVLLKHCEMQIADSTQAGQFQELVKGSVGRLTGRK